MLCEGVVVEGSRDRGKEGRMGGERQARVRRTKVRGGRKFIVAIDAINAGGVWPSAAPMVGCLLGRISPSSLPSPSPSQ